jgi:NAD(P)-dependent dehydrogenase (short-subunit alcohol dehydrogenase family)
MQGKVALITGASSGIGAATAAEFAARGAAVMLAARRADELEAQVRLLTEGGAQASAIVTDVSDAAAVERMVAHTIATFGSLDYAVNNAGIEGTFVSITELEEADWDRAIDVNLKGTFLCLKYEARAMLAAARGGAIVNVGSINSFLGFAGGGPYVASKHGMIGLTTSVSAELAPQGIRVNLVCPGLIDTPMHRRGRTIFGDANYDRLIADRIHARRAGEPEEIAKAIAFLCSDDASYISGSTLTTDGGLTLTM